MDTFINAIYLYDDKMLITFNYKEGTETVSFGEATEAAAKEKVRIWIALVHQKCRKTERSCGFFVCSARAGMLARQRRRILHALARQKAKRLADGAIGASAGLLFVHLRVCFAQKGPSGRPAGAAQRGAGGRKGTLDSGGGG